MEHQHLDCFKHVSYLLKQVVCYLGVHFLTLAVGDVVELYALSAIGGDVTFEESERASLYKQSRSRRIN